MNHSATLNWFTMQFGTAKLSLTHCKLLKCTKLKHSRQPCASDCIRKLTRTCILKFSISFPFHFQSCVELSARHIKFCQEVDEISVLAGLKQRLTFLHKYLKFSENS